MVKYIINFLFCALYGLLTETAPVGVDSWKESDDFINNIVVIPELKRPGTQNGTNRTSLAMATTTRTVTSIVTHTVDWYSLPSSLSPVLGSSPSPGFVTAPLFTSPSPINGTSGAAGNRTWDAINHNSAGMTRISILYVVFSIMCVSILYLMVHILCNLSSTKKLRRWCCTPQKADSLRGVELEESAGVSWTEGSNLTSPHPEIRAPDEWPGTWAEMVAVGGADAFGSTGRARLPSAGETVRRGTRSGIQGAVPRDGSDGLEWRKTPES